MNTCPGQVEKPFYCTPRHEQGKGTLSTRNDRRFCCEKLPSTFASPFSWTHALPLGSPVRRTAQRIFSEKQAECLASAQIRLVLSSLASISLGKTITAPRNQNGTIRLRVNHPRPRLITAFLITVCRTALHRSPTFLNTCLFEM